MCAHTGVCAAICHFWEMRSATKEGGNKRENTKQKERKTNTKIGINSNILTIGLN